MIEQHFKDIYTEELAEGAILNEEFEGFKEDYLILHCLLRKHKPKRFLEIGTNMGTGTKIICNAIPDAKVYSLDLPPEDAHKSLQHPISEGKGSKTGTFCDLPFEQIFCDSLEFEYENIQPIDGWFIDGEHDYRHPYHETKNAMWYGPKIIIWHDSDIQNVYNAITDAIEADYKLYRVIDTRIAYAIK